MKLTHIIYASDAQTGLSRPDLDSILSVARQNNERLDVTGMLLYSLGSFLQVLEGDGDVLDHLVASISADPRHNRITLIIREAVKERSFGDWTMGFAGVKLSELNSIEGFNDFFHAGDSLTQLQPGRAKKILSAFADGQWHNAADRPPLK